MKPIKKGDVDIEQFKKDVDEVDLRKCIEDLNYRIKEGLLNGRHSIYFEIWGYNSNETLEKAKGLFEKSGWTFETYNIWYSFSWRVNVKIYLK